MQWWHRAGRPADFASTVLRGGYDVGSGTLSIVSPAVSTTLNKYGQYVSTIESASFDDDALNRSSTMSDSRTADEAELARMRFGDVQGVNYAPVIGFHLGLYAGHVAEGDYRASGSSGGFVSWILDELLATGRIDGVVHVAELWGDDGVLFRYVVSRNAAEVRARAKSRYYPVEISGALQEVLSNPGRYAVVGIPSVLSEVRLLAENNPVLKERIAFTVGLICGHQKSTKYVESFAWQCGIKPGDLRSFDFRKKRAEGPAWDYCMEMTGLIDGELVTLSRSQHELFGSDWGHGFFKAKFSDFTDDALNETADVAVGDAWLQQYDSDNLGNNVVIVRDPEIQQMVDAAVKDGRLCFDAVTVETVLRSQRGLIHHTWDELPYRLEREDRRGSWRPRRRVEPGGDRIGLLRRLVQDARTRMAEQSHVHYLGAVERGEWSYFERRMARHVRWYVILYKLIALQKTVRSGGVVGVLKLVVRRIGPSA